MSDVEVEVQENDETIADDDQSVINKIKSNVRHRKGRGFNEQKDRLTSEIDDYEHITNENETDRGPARSVEGWILFIRNVHEEAQEDTLHDLFNEYGHIKNLHLNLDRRSGFAKGYALVEYETFPEAKNALDNINGQDLLGHKLQVDWAFVKGSSNKRGMTNKNTRKSMTGTGRTTYQRR
jgi:RNA-binding protein 8A